MSAIGHRKIRLGDLLVEHNVITDKQLKHALDSQKNTGRKLGRVLVDSGYISEDELTDFLAQQLNIQVVDLKQTKIDPSLVQSVPEAQARRLLVIPIKEEANAIIVGMADPTNIFAFDELTKLLFKPIKIVIVKENELLKVFDSVYKHTSQLNGLAAEIEQELFQGELNTQTTTAITSAPVVKLLNTLFEDALVTNTSDIHIEPGENELRIRFRVDGVLRVQTTAERRISHALISRLKLMANLDISEKRLPQDGRFNTTIRDKSLDIRLSILPTQHGESAVLRLLNLSDGIKGLSNIGMPDKILLRFRKLSHSANGLILVTGPTGSGKTTTLYSTLTELNEPSTKIITVEDPVEYRLDGINQVQVLQKINLDFATVLRTILRQDPDIILIGEIRDLETVNIALKAAMTGHLVFSTLHTNDAISTAARLLDMGAEPYIMAAALRGIVTQRLLRKLCEHCSEIDHDSKEELTFLQHHHEDTPIEKNHIRKAKGCNYCNQTGYQGRMGIYEYVEINREIAASLQNNDINEFSNLARKQEHYQTIDQSAISLLNQGHTTIEELIRIGINMDGT